MRFAQIVFIDPQNAPKSFAPDPTGGAYNAPPDPLAGLRGLLLRDLLLRGREGRRFYCVINFRRLVTPLFTIYRMISLSMTFSDL